MVFGIATTAVKPPSAAAAAAGLDRLGVLVARLAQVHVQVDQAGGDDAAAGVEDPSGPVEPGRRPRRPPVADQHVGDPLATAVDDAPALDEEPFRQSGLPIRGATTAPPCAPRPRWSPAP